MRRSFARSLSFCSLPTGTSQAKPMPYWLILALGAPIIAPYISSAVTRIFSCQRPPAWYPKITKQSLSRVLTQLIDEGYVCQETDSTDRRRRLLLLSDKGVALERQLTARQCRRVIGAFENAGDQLCPRISRHTRAIIDPKDRHRVGRQEAGPQVSERRLVG